MMFFSDGGYLKKLLKGFGNGITNNYSRFWGIWLEKDEDWVKREGKVVLFQTEEEANQFPALVGSTYVDIWLSLKKNDWAARRYTGRIDSDCLLVSKKEPE